MIQANQFVPIAFEATVVGFGLTKSVGKLAARLLATHGDLVDDELGFHIPKRSATDGELRIPFRDRGFLTVTPLWANFQGSLPEDAGKGTDWPTEPIAWAVDLLMSILTFQKSKVMALDTELIWALSEHTSTAPFAAHFGLSQTLGGFFVSSEDFEIRGDTTVQLPDLFPVYCGFRAGRLNDFVDPFEVGVQIRHRSPDNRFDDTAIKFTRATVDQFFATSPGQMEQQLAQYFPIRGGT